MKEKLLTALKTEYAKSGLSEKAFDGVAAVLAKTVANEEEVEGVVKSDETRSLIRAFQADTDRVRQEKAQISSEFERYKTEHPESKAAEEQPVSDDGRDELLKRIEALENDRKEREAAASRERRMAGIRASLKSGGSDNDNILDLVLDKAAFKDDESDNSVVERLKSAYDATYAKFYGDGAVPRSHRSGAAADIGKEDAAFVEKLRRDGVIQNKES